jgi:hypothetical protein
LESFAKHFGVAARAVDLASFKERQQTLHVAAGSSAKQFMAVGN